MHLVYVDEVKYEPPVQPYYWLGGLGIPDRSIQSADKALSRLAKEFFGTAILDANNEFHAKHILHGKGPFKGKDLESRVALYKKLLDVIADTEGIARIEIRLDPAKMLASQFTDKAFMFLVEKLDEHMAAERSLALLIADEDRDIAGVNVASLSAFKARGTDFAFGRPITRVVDTIHHTRSHHSRLLQLADVYVYTLAMVAGPCEKYPRSEIAGYAKSKDRLLFPTKYRNWPS